MKKYILLFILILTITNITGCTSQVYKQNLNDGDLAFSEGRYKDALVFYKEAQKENDTDEIKLKIEEAYIYELKNISNEILSQATISEKMLHTYSKVWEKSFEIPLDDSQLANLLGIPTFKLRDIIQPKDVIYYSFKGDFNEAIRKTHEYFEKTKKNEEVEKGREQITSELKLLNNPPDKYKELYDLTIELYTLYEKYVDLSLSPSGTLVTFNQNIKEIATEIISKTKEINIKLPIE